MPYVPLSPFQIEEGSSYFDVPNAIAAMDNHETSPHFGHYFGPDVEQQMVLDSQPAQPEFKLHLPI